MTSIRSAILVGAALIAGSFSAQAADLGAGRGGSLKDYGYTPQMVASPAASWYVRIDGGHARFDDPLMVEDGRFDLTHTNYDDAWSLGGGVGHYFSKNWRGDVSVTHFFETDVKGNLQAGSSINGERRFGMDSTVVLASLYYDFDLRSRLTPYVGVGLGAVHHRTKAGIVSDACGCTGVIEAADQWHVAAAAMAGFSVALRGGRQEVAGGSVKDGHVFVDSGRALHLDVGYRFLYLGEASTGPIRATTVALPAVSYVSNDPTIENIHAHEFRVGLRYDIR